MRHSLLGQGYAERPALVVDGSPPLSYRGLEERVQRLAEKLPERQLIFLISANDVPSLTCYLAALLRGAVPLLLGRGLATDQLNSLIQIYDPPYVFIHEDTPWETVDATVEWREGSYAFFCRQASARPALHEKLALLLATSGSTGSPKLVRLSMENLVSNADSIIQYLGITPQDRAITSLPFYYSYGMSVVNSHLRAGASLVLSNDSLMDKAFWEKMRSLHVTSFAGVPYSYEMLLKLRLERMIMPSMRTMTQAGGRLEPKKIAQVDDICKKKDIRFFTMYGQTEASPRIAFLAPEDTERKLGSIGKAIPGGELWIEDESGCRLDAPGVVGELVYAGPNVSLGYAECPDELALGDINQGILRTGDLARMDEDGYFFIEGRRHRFLKMFGVRVSLDSVEEIASAWGWICAAHGSDDRLVLFAVESQQLVPSVLKTDMATALRVHSSAISVRTLSELPRLSTGKVDYQCLSRML